MSEIGELSLYFENNAAINIVNNPVKHDRTKQFKIDLHFIKKRLQVYFSLLHVTSEKQLANVLTKGLTRSTIHSLICKLGMLSGSVDYLINLILGDFISYNNYRRSYFI